MDRGQDDILENLGWFSVEMTMIEGRFGRVKSFIIEFNRLR